MSIYDLTSGKKVYDFQLDVGTVSSISGKRYHTEMFYSFCSFLTPNVIHKVDFVDGAIKDTVRMNLRSLFLRQFLNNACRVRLFLYLSCK